MDNEILEITIKPHKKPKTKFGRWWKNKISHPFYSFKLKFKAWFFGSLYKLVLACMSKEKREKILQEDQEIEVKFVNETGDDKVTEQVKESLQKSLNLKEDKDIDEAVKKRLLI